MGMGNVFRLLQAFRKTTGIKAALAGGLMVAGAFGCNRDALGPSARIVDDSDSSRTTDIPALAANRNLCTIVVWDPTTGASSRGTVHSFRLPETTESRHTDDRDSLGTYRFARWNKSNGTKLVDAVCVVPLTAAAGKQAAQYIHTFGVDSDSLKIATLKRSGISGPLFSWTGEWVYCDYYPATDDIECDGGGVYCGLWATRRTPAADPSFARAPGSSSAGPRNSTYYCDNGCQIVDFDGYYCPESGGTEFTGGSPGGYCGPTVDSLVAEYTTGPHAPDNFTGVTCDIFSQSGGSAHFSWSELNGGWSGGNEHPPWGLIRPTLLSNLESARTTFNTAIYLSSGFRCPNGNASVGGVPNSYHLQGRAADMYSTSSHSWTQAQFDSLYDVFSSQGGYTELFTYTTYSDHHLHAAY
jgi:hypothetical protein